MPIGPPSQVPDPKSAFSFDVAPMLAIHVAAGYGTSGVSDSMRDLYWADAILRGEALPLRGPVIYNTIELGPWWYYVVAAALAVSGSLAGAAAIVAALAALKYALAWRLGRRLEGPALGLAFVAALVVPEAVERAVRLREIARSADVVVLHHFGCDVVPIAALAVNDVPAVSVVNHADHIFWLGSTIADVVVNQRPISAALGPRRRVRGQFLLPIPLQDRSPIARDAARDQLRIPREQLMAGRGW